MKKALQKENPLQIIGTINAYTAIMAEHAGFKALYVSGAGVANASLGLPDLGLSHLGDVSEDVRRISAASSLPILVDADTGWGNALSIARAVRELNRAGASALHLEDQEGMKRCGHRPGKQLVDTKEMCDRIKAAVDAKLDSSFMIMARTDAIANEGLESALERAQHYVAAGAELLFAEAVTELEHYQQFVKTVSVPVLANITEFGKTPLFSLKELASVGVRMVLYPLSAFRAMNKAALHVYETIKKSGSQQTVLETMQTRDELYDFLNYYELEQQFDT